MRHYEELATREREGFEIIVDRTWEDLSPRDLFDAEDADEICTRIDAGELDWFMLRVRIMLDGHEVGSHYLGGCCYEDARDVLTDGTAEDCIHAALREARDEVRRLRERLNAFEFE